MTVLQIHGYHNGEFCTNNLTSRDKTGGCNHESKDIITKKNIFKTHQLQAYLNLPVHKKCDEHFFRFKNRILKKTKHIGLI